MVSYLGWKQLMYRIPPIMKHPSRRVDREGANVNIIPRVPIARAIVKRIIFRCFPHQRFEKDGDTGNDHRQERKSGKKCQNRAYPPVLEQSQAYRPRPDSLRIKRFRSIFVMSVGPVEDGEVCGEVGARHCGDLGAFR